MNFIKGIFRKVCAFFSGLFSKKAVAPVAAPNAPAANAPAFNADAADVAEAEQAKIVRKNELAEIYNRIADLAKFRNYSLNEAYNAYNADDKDALVRIEKAMKAKTYKAPKGKNSKIKAAA